MSGPISFSADTGGAYGAMGYISGISKSFKTDIYLTAVLAYSRARLALFFDEWMDIEAQADRPAFQHVYEWPSEFGATEETVGVARFRLWKHVFSGSGKNGTASFQFLPSTVPTPVDPILTDPSETGKTVREHIHVFVWKAEAFEYGIHIVVTPHLAQYLAYVAGPNKSGGEDKDLQKHLNIKANEDGEDGGSVMLSKGPVEFEAGGGKFVGNFTTKYLYWWSNLASGDFDNRIAPAFQAELTNEAQYNDAIKLGTRSRSKAINIGAQASQDAATFAEAEAMAQEEMQLRATAWIRAAAAQRRGDQINAEQ